MTELWWWVEPLFETGFILFLFAGIIAFATLESGIDVWFWIIVILLLPLFIATAATIIWGVSWVFWFIWARIFERLVTHMKHKHCFGKCDRCVWKTNGGCSEWRMDYDRS